MNFQSCDLRATIRQHIQDDQNQISDRQTLISGKGGRKDASRKFPHVIPKEISDKREVQHCGENSVIEIL